jgi:nucleoside-diphosphate-sugar epimerase
VSKPRLLITGISGFIGQALVEKLHKKYKIYGIYEKESSTEKNPEIPEKRKWVVDLRNAPLMEVVVMTIQPDFVIHLAARSEVANSFDNYEEVADINYKGTVILAEALRKHVPNLKLFVMASTMETYGHQDTYTPFDEDTPQHPMAPYAVAKVASERYLEYMEYAYAFPFTILRQTNAYGRKDNSFFVVERIISQFCGDFWKISLGDPVPMRNFIYIDDLVELYEVLLEKYFVAQGETFVTGPDNAVAIGDLYEQIAKKFDDAWSGDPNDVVEWYTIPPRPGEIMYLNSDPLKAEEVLGWKPKTSLDEGLDKTIAYWKEKTNYDQVWWPTCSGRTAADHED